MRIKARRCVVVVALATLALSGQASAQRTLISEQAVKAKDVPGGAILGACGIAFRGAQIYVSNYYKDTIEIFNLVGEYQSQLHFDSPSGPCQLATSPTNDLYVNDWHEGVSRLLPSSLSFDEAESTGIAVDQSSGNVYVNNRTYIAVYEPSGDPLLSEGQPLKVGLGTLGDGYGLAFFAGRLYVPDASDSTVKVYEPAVDTVNPVLSIDGSATPQGGFNSLVDAAVAVDPANAHLIVLDNLQPGFEHPQAALDEFDFAGNFLGQVSKKLIDAEPSGVAFSSSGGLYATSGNGAEGTVFAFGPYVAGGSLSVPQAKAADSPQVSAALQSAVPAAGQTIAAPPPVRAHRHRHRSKRHLAAKARQKQAKARR